MRTSPAALALFFAALTPGQAAEITATSRVSAVTVFPSGAEVQRTVRVALERGQHVVVLNDLPAEANPASLRVAGKASAQIDIGSVDTRRVRLQSADAATIAAERKKIEDEIEGLKDQRSALETLIETAQTQKQLILNLTELPKRPPAAQPSTALARQDDWSQVLALIGSGMTDVHRTVLETSVRIRDTDRRIKDLEKKLTSLAPAPRERTEAKINVTALAPLEGELTVTYLVRSSSWTSHYDARLTTGTKAQASKLALTRRATVQQRTGEPWNDVTLSLSTARPTQRAAAPTLDAVTVDFEPERRPPPPAPVASAPAPRARGLGFEERALRKATAKPDAEMRDTRETQADVDAAAYHAIFTPAGRTSVADTGEAKRLFIDEHTLDAALAVHTVPKLDTTAYLYAKLTLPKGAPYLPGRISLFRDGTFVGTGRLPQLPAGAEHELGFGPDDLVRVQYVVVDEKKGETGLISASRTDQRLYRITVKNLHERAVLLSVRDQIPVSLNQDIKVELLGKSAPTRRNIDDIRGTLAWETKAEPDTETAVEFGYRVSWPSAKAVQYGR